MFPIYNVEAVDKQSLINETIGEWIKLSYELIAFNKNNLKETLNLIKNV